MAKSHHQRFRAKLRKIDSFAGETILLCPRCGLEPSIITHSDSFPIAFECEDCELLAGGNSWDEAVAAWIGLR